ncbi:triosephosphate isomerase [Anaerobacterium chartisolvens]|uniref:Triosephosphate isomerase n=1 Tax=Anaerobacterium chartisolvens TaxID=1297424 RepID=A0A369B4H3_9FIRM|nr:triose-phosphate isomerase [Anaerobacterium chartisolvens]RCX16351.1 triosephosphate isomerase [Anaerobacterium chartisolvens]
MYKGINIKLPFFEIGPKALIYGDTALKLAKVADSVAAKYDVHIIFTPQYTDIPTIASQTENLLVFAQHMDSLPVGKGQGSVLPEAVKAAGAAGVMLNHAEKRISLSEINKTIKRADEVGLLSMVCTDTVEEAAAVAHLAPNIIVAEPPELIGTGNTSDMNYVRESINAVKSINPDIHVLQGAGISSGEDVYSVIMAGAVATGSTSGIIKSGNPEAMVEEMIYSLRKAWNKINKGD